jgi:hypothetical protein
VPDLVASERRARAFSIFYTGAIGTGATAPILYGIIGDALGVMPAVLIIAGLVLLTLPLSLEAAANGTAPQKPELHGTIEEAADGEAEEILYPISFQQGCKRTS